MRALALVVLIACKGDATKPPPPAVPLKPGIAVNGNAITPRTVLAATRGGETVYVEISTEAHRECADLFDHDGVSLGSDEVSVSLQLARPLFAKRPGWDVVDTHWPGGISSGHELGKPDAKSTTAVTLPDDLAAKGGALQLRFDGAFQVGTAAPRATLAIDGTFDVKPCGDRGKELGPPQPLEVHVGQRELPIRGALLVASNDRLELQLSSLRVKCPVRGGRDSGGDLAIDLTIQGDATSQVHVWGDLVATQLSDTPGSYRVTVRGTSVTIDGEGTDFAPLVIHGHVEAERCTGD